MISVSVLNSQQVCSTPYLLRSAAYCIVLAAISTLHKDDYSAELGVTSIYPTGSGLISGRCVTLSLTLTL